MQQEEPITLHHFLGSWVGQTQGCDMPAHLWEITLFGPHLRIHTRWEGETESVQFIGRLVPGEPAFTVSKSKATLLDRQHFVIPGWCSNDRRKSEGPSYDVIFSRPGIAELTARAVYQRSLETPTGL
jgi:hypothetical protein